MSDDTNKRIEELEQRLDAIAPKPERSREEILADLDRDERAILARQHWAKLVSDANHADYLRLRDELWADFYRLEEKRRIAGQDLDKKRQASEQRHQLATQKILDDNAAAMQRIFAGVNNASP
jgi:hypothetical protein